MPAFTPRMFAVCVALTIGPPVLMVALNYQQWFAPKPIYPWLVKGEVLFFETNWCGVCKAMKPVVAKLQDEGFDIRTVDADTHQNEAMEYGIRAVPTFVLVRDGEEVRRTSGYVSPDDLKQLWR